jgi:hypothetical protein
MQGPRQQGTDQQGHDRIAGDQRHNCAGGFRRRRPGQKTVDLRQSEQHQAQTYEHPSHILGLGASGVAKGYDANENEDGGNGADVKGQHLGNKGGADIGAQHDRKAWQQIEHGIGRQARYDQTRSRTALQKRCGGKPGAEGRKAVA